MSAQPSPGQGSLWGPCSWGFGSSDRGKAGGGGPRHTGGEEQEHQEESRGITPSNDPILVEVA